MKKSRFCIGLLFVSFGICSLTSAVVAAPALEELKSINDSREEDFYRAAAKGDNAQITALLNQGVDIDAKSGWMNGEFKGGSTIFLGEWQGPALVIAAGKGQLETVKLLVGKGAKINAQDDMGGSALLYAARYGHLEVVKFLLEHQAEVNPKDKLAQVPLIEATSYGHLNVVKWLLQNGADVNATGYLGSSALTLAISRKRLDIVHVLLEYKADVNIKDKYTGTALVAAVKDGNMPELVKTLIAKGADVNAYNEHGWTVLQQVASGAHFLEVGRLLKEAGARWNGWTKLMYAIEEKDLTKVKSLLKQGADINERAARGESALTQALGQPEMLEFLLAHKADANIKNNRGETNLIWALMSGRRKGARILLEHGCDPNSRTSFGDSALAQAMQYPEVVQLLIDKGADLKYVDREGRTALDIAVLTRCFECVEMLKKAGAKRSETASSQN